MMRPFTCFILLLAITCAALADPLKYTIFVKGEKVGTLVSETTGDDENGYVDDSTTTFTQQGSTLIDHELTHYGKDGVATSKSMELTVGEAIVKIKAVLSDAGAKISAWVGDEKKEDDIPLVTKTTRADPSNFWFKKEKPEVGHSITYQAFNIQEKKWADVTLKYIGKSKIKVADKEIEENEIERTEGEEKVQFYVDDKGDAVVMTDGEMRIERQM